MIRVVVADDQPMARERLVSLLGAEPGIEVAGTASSGPEAVDCIVSASPDLVFLDLQMPGMDGFKVIEAIGVDRMRAAMSLGPGTRIGVYDVTGESVTDTLARVIERRRRLLPTLVARRPPRGLQFHPGGGPEPLRQGVGERPARGAAARLSPRPVRQQLVGRRACPPVQSARPERGL